MSGSGKALINIIYECCLIQPQRPRNQNKQIFEGFSGSKRQKPRERGAKVSKSGAPLPPATIGRAIRLLSSISRVQAGASPPGRRETAGAGRKQERIRPEVPRPPPPHTAPCGDLRSCSAARRGSGGPRRLRAPAKQLPSNDWAPAWPGSV